jgi:hypothetical protein
LHATPYLPAAYGARIAPTRLHVDYFLVMAKSRSGCHLAANGFAEGSAALDAMFQSETSVSEVVHAGIFLRFFDCLTLIT